MPRTGLVALSSGMGSTAVLTWATPKEGEKKLSSHVAAVRLMSSAVIANCTGGQANSRLGTRWQARTCNGRFVHCSIQFLLAPQARANSWWVSGRAQSVLPERQGFTHAGPQAGLHSCSLSGKARLSQRLQSGEASGRACLFRLSAAGMAAPRQSSCTVSLGMRSTELGRGHAESEGLAEAVCVVSGLRFRA